MRTLYFLFLVTFAGVVALFAYQNDRPETVTLGVRSWELSLPALVGLTYLLGMLSGWTVFGMVRRSWRHAVEDPRS